jgi:PAS domain S-box-containing protein
LKGPAFEAVLDSLNEGVAVVDALGVITIFNMAAQRITGLFARDVIGSNACDIIPRLGLHLTVEHGRVEGKVLQSFGEKKVVITRKPLHDGEGSLSGAVAIVRDLTEVDKLSAEVMDLWQSRQLLKSVIESIDDAISVADADGNNIIVNPAYSRLTGLPRDAVIGKPTTVDIAEGESMHNKVQRTRKTVRNVPLKVGPLKRDVIVHVSPIVIDGLVRGSVGIIHDISEIKRLTTELTETRGLLRRLRARYTWDDIIGDSEAINSAREQALRAAGTPATVLLRGESGTGKELFAHAIHNESARQKEQFVSVNCAAIAESLLESELFGYEEGAFTGALKGGKKGLFEEAQGGTIFLDEIGDMGPSIQSKLLRFLQEKEVVRVGGAEPVKLDVRVIAATNADLERMIKEGAFREDLYYRLNVLPINIIPLRQRCQDVPQIATHMLFRLNQEYHRLVERISSEALDTLCMHSWPGNVRELQNVLGQAMLNMHPKDKVIEVSHLPGFSGGLTEVIESTSPGSVRKLKDLLADAEHAAIRSALRQTEGNRTEAAKLLGVAIRSLYYKIEKYNIE